MALPLSKPSKRRSSKSSWHSSWLSRIIILTLLILGGVFYHFSTVMNKLTLQKQELITQITQEKHQQHILQAEWSYLARPDRLYALKKQFFKNLSPALPQHIQSLDAFSQQTKQS